MNRNIGFVLIAIGIIMLIWTGFTYTKKEKIIDLGPLQVSADRQKTVSWPPILGGVVLIAGIGVLVLGRRKE
jgi:LPXTG-motif cell wall-anchored protein